MKTHPRKIFIIACQNIHPFQCFFPFLVCSGKKNIYTQQNFQTNFKKAPKIFPVAKKFPFEICWLQKKFLLGLLICVYCRCSGPSQGAQVESHIRAMTALCEGRSRIPEFHPKLGHLYLIKERKVPL